jgi:hypothetical protein
MKDAGSRLLMRAQQIGFRGNERFWLGRLPSCRFLARCQQIVVVLVLLQRCAGFGYDHGMGGEE